MSDSTTARLEEIQSMLAAGHRSLCVERHSLVLWGLTGSALVLASNKILTPEQFPAVEHQAIAWLVLLATVLGGVAVADWYLTRRSKQKRDQTLSFVHRQILKVWWLLLALGTLLSFATFFFGGGYMVNAAWLILVGVGLYVHGLFSEKLLEGAGGLMIVVGICILVSQLSIETTKHVVASVFGLGMPLLAAMLGREAAPSAWRRSIKLGLWTLCVVGAPLAVSRFAAAITVPDVPVVPLERFVREASAGGSRIVSLPAGTLVPIKVDVSGDLFASSQDTVWPLVLAKPVDLLVVDGKLSGEFRIAGEDWSRGWDALRIWIPSLSAQLTPQEGPTVRAILRAQLKRDAR